MDGKRLVTVADGIDMSVGGGERDADEPLRSPWVNTSPGRPSG